MMKPVYFQKETPGRERWMVSYIDVMTILVILFVAIAAQSVRPHPLPTVNIPRPVEKIAVAAPPIDPLSPVLDALRTKGLDARRETRGVVIRLPHTLIFRAGDDRLVPEAMPALTEVAEVLQSISNRVGLVGYADAAPIHNQRFQSNWELAAARSLRILNLLSHDFAIDESRLSVESYGPYDPRDSNDTPDGRASNRRVEIIIFPPTPSDAGTAGQ